MVANLATLALALAASASTVSAHSIVTSVWVNGVDTATGDAGVAASYLRTPSSNSPVQDLTSSSMACNDKGATPAASTLSIAAGDTIEPEWWHSGARGADPIDPSHLGPITAWISPYVSDGADGSWVEIASEAYYSDAAEWAVTKMIANKGRNTVVIPSTLAPGKYIVRFDLLALHSAEEAGGAQFYPNCADIVVTGSGETALPEGVKIPGFFTEQTPGVVWIYYSTTYDVTGDYVAPGTGTWDGSSSYSTDTCSTVVDGLAPAGYCQDGSSSSAVPTTTASKASTTPDAASTSILSSSSSQPVVSSEAATSSAPASSQLAVTSAVTTATTMVVGSSTGAPSSTLGATSTASASEATYTDYNSCMNAYNKCLDAHQPKNGGAADFSSCYTMNCATLPAKRFRRLHRAAGHRG